METLAQEMTLASNLGDHCRALRLAERIGRTRMGPPLRAFIAREQQLLGLLVEAGRNAALCVQELEADAARQTPCHVDLPRWLGP